tara:strand:+ start:21097 stop:21909 length:813 start_codon:yes stop_codon:yes gene_type:complete
MNNFRIGFCFYGQTRLEELISVYYKSWKNYSNIEIDFFVATWDDFKNKKIYNYFKNKKFIKFKDSKLPTDQGNTRKMAFLLKEVNRLKKQEEEINNFTYDFIIYTRPDVMLGKKETFKYLKEQLLESKKNDNSIFTLSPIRLNKENYYLDSDFAFFSTSQAFDNHSQLYDFFFKNESKLQQQYTKVEGGHYTHGIIIKEKIKNIFSISLPSVIIRPKVDISLLRKHLFNKDIFSILADNKAEWKPATDLGYDNNYIVSGSTVVNFKEGII